MAKDKMSDKVLNESRKKAIEKAHLPQNIKESFSVSIESGRVILSKKNHRK